MMKNTIEIQDNKVVKTFASHMDFVREQSIYEKLKGTGLAPELTGNFDGALEHEFVVGADFEEVLKASASNPEELISNIKLFIEWYKAFREKVNLSLGDTDFSDFVLKDGKLICIDFEHCKPGKPEEDVANLAADICLGSGDYTRIGMENAKIFVKTAWENTSLDAEKLYVAMKASLENYCHAHNIETMDSVNEYLSCFVTSSFAHFPRGENQLEQITSILGRSDRMWMLFAEDVDMEDDRFIRYLLGAAKGDYDALFMTDSGTVILCPLLLRVRNAIMTLELAKTSGMSFKDALIIKMNSKALAVENLK